MRSLGMRVSSVAIVLSEALEGRLDQALAMFNKALRVDPVRSRESAGDAIRAVEAAIARRARPTGGRAVSP